MRITGPTTYAACAICGATITRTPARERRRRVWLVATAATGAEHAGECRPGKHRRAAAKASRAGQASLDL